MKCLKLIILAFAFLTAQLYAEIQDYHLAAGDVVSIHVYGQADLSVKAKIDNKGVINYPFIGEVLLINKTTSEVRESISEALKDGYLIAPEVHVSVIEYRPFYIHGQVKRPGSFAYQPGLVLAKAIALAGGLTERASNTWLLERNSGEIKIEANSQTEILPGDVITIKQSFF